MPCHQDAYLICTVLYCNEIMWERFNITPSFIKVWYISWHWKSPKNLLFHFLREFGSFINFTGWSYLCTVLYYDCSSIEEGFCCKAWASNSTNCIWRPLSQFPRTHLFILFIFMVVLPNDYTSYKVKHIVQHISRLTICDVPRTQDTSSSTHRMINLKHQWRTLNPFQQLGQLFFNQWSEHSTWETYVTFLNLLLISNNP